jgi:hypothetical protein
MRFLLLLVFAIDPHPDPPLFKGRVRVGIQNRKFKKTNLN